MLVRAITDSTKIRFVVIGGLGELLYLGLFSFMLHWGLVPSLAVAAAGSICLAMNAYLHTRVSFRVPFRRSLLASYAAVQAACLAIAVTTSQLLGMLKVNGMAIGVISTLAWMLSSFILTRYSYQRGNTRKG